VPIAASKAPSMQEVLVMIRSFWRHESEVKRVAQVLLDLGSRFPVQGELIRIVPTRSIESPGSENWATRQVGPTPSSALDEPPVSPRSADLAVAGESAVADFMPAVLVVKVESTRRIPAG